MSVVDDLMTSVVGIKPVVGAEEGEAIGEEIMCGVVK